MLGENMRQSTSVDVKPVQSVESLAGYSEWAETTAAIISLKQLYTNSKSKPD